MTVEQGRTALGIELGSTRVKAVLVDKHLQTVATGGAEWRSELVDGHWTYSLDAVWRTIREAVASLRTAFHAQHGEQLSQIGALGISAMMHGYLAFDAEDKLLVPFRTWQDTTTEAAAEALSQRFQTNIPQRWSIAHLHQAMLDGETHVPRVAYLTTLAGYVHWQLSGQRVLGIGDASGMFPVDSATGTYDANRVASFDQLAQEHGVGWRLLDLLPAVRRAGEDAGQLSKEGALLLDPTGELMPGCVVAPPEGDAGTGMVATNSVRPRTANVSAGTSIFAMVVLDHDLQAMHEELDLVTTPDGAPVVMVHCNNGAVDLQDWVMLFGEAARLLGAEFDADTLFGTLYQAALAGAPDAGGLVAFNYRAGEPITALGEGRPLFVRMPESKLDVANFLRSHLYAAFATLRLGFEILESEDVHVDELFAHGGIFRTKGVAQRFLAAALDVPVSVSATVGEGGAWGMAVLAAYALTRPGDLPTWLDKTVFADTQLDTVEPQPEDVAGFRAFMNRYSAALAVERAAVDALQRRDA